METSKIQTGMEAGLKSGPTLRNDRSIWRTVAVILAGCGVASTVAAQTMSEDVGTPSGNVIQENLTGGSAANGAGNVNGVDYLNALNPGEVFTASGGTTLTAVSVQGNGDAGYYTPNDESSTAYGIYQGYSDGLASVSGLVPLLEWDIQIGSVSGTTITTIANESVTGFAPVSNSSFITFNLAGSGITLPTTGTYEFSMTLDISTLDDFGYGVQPNPSSGAVWYGLAESKQPVASGIGSANALYGFDNGTDAGELGSGVLTGAVNKNAGYSALGDNYVYVLQGVPEPATMALVGLGAMGMMAALRRRRA
jgi:hypothetical protein